MADGHGGLPAQAKALRSDGVSWAAIARLLGLADAAAARALYKSVYGKPPTVQSSHNRTRGRVDGFDWLDRVACRDRTTFFFSEDEDDQAEAERICKTECPVLAQCQQWRKASRPSAGVWAGRAYART